MTLHLLQADDWIGVYIDEMLVYESHEIDPQTLLDLLGIAYTNEWVEDLEESGGRCPMVRERQLTLPGME